MCDNNNKEKKIRIFFRHVGRKKNDPSHKYENNTAEKVVLTITTILQYVVVNKAERIFGLGNRFWFGSSAKTKSNVHFSEGMKRNRSNEKMRLFE